MILQSIVFFTFAKLGACLIIIVARFVSLVKGNTENVKIGFEDITTDVREWSDAFNAKFSHMVDMALCLYGGK